MAKYIHYFINEDKKIPEFSKNCIDTWKNLLPGDFDLKFWTINDLETIEDETAKKLSKINNYSLKKTFLKIYVMKTYGGIYVDQNIKLVKNIDDLIDNNKSFLGLDERHNINTGVWYEQVADGYLPTKLYEKFIKLYDKAIYNAFFVDLSILLKEILTDFDPTNTHTQKLNHNVVIYGYDYFYPLSYDGHTKNISKNTKAYNYFHYDFITPKGKIKNIMCSTLGYSSFKKIASLYRKLKNNIFKHNFKYKNYQVKDKEKHLKLLNKTIEKIPQYKNKYYIAFHNPDWTGVSNATIELFENSITCGELYNKKEIRTISNLIVKNNIKEVIFSGFCIGWKELAISLHKKGIIIKTYFHGSHSQYMDEYGWEMNKQIYLLEKKGVVTEMALCKESLVNFYKDKNCNISFLRNIVNIDYNIEKKEKKKNECRIGIYAVQTTNWRKNVFSSLGGAYLYSKKIKNKKVVVDIVPKSDAAETFCHILGMETEGVVKAIPREELLNRMSKCNISLYVTFSECAPMLPLESFYVGVPCITGNNHHYFKDTELEQYLVVNNENNSKEISDKMELCIDNEKKLLELYKEFSKNNLEESKKLVKNYIDSKGDSHEKI